MDESQMLSESRLITSQEVSAQYFEFLDGNTGITATFYSLPSSSNRDRVFGNISHAIINLGNLGPDPYSSRIKSIKELPPSVDITHFSSPEKAQRLHFKSYSTPQSEGLITTSNPSMSAITNYARYGKASDRYRSIFNPFDSRIYQANLSLVISPKDNQDLRQVQESIARNAPLQSKGKFLRADIVERQLLKDIARAEANDTITIASPYIDSTNVAIALSHALEKGVKVNLITQNLDTKIKDEEFLGGSRTGISDFITRIQSLGAQVYTPDERDPLLFHTKAVSITGENINVGYIGSSNLTRAAGTLESLDYMFREEGLGTQIKAALQADIAGFQLQLKDGSDVYAAEQAGVSNPHLLPFFSRDRRSPRYTTPSAFGASSFYEKALINADRTRNGLERIPYSTEYTSGFASSIYRLHRLGQDGVTPIEIPGYIRQYDREMAVPGLGTYINEWALARGYGRIYKDEEGAVASLFGAFGAAIDRSVMFYSDPSSYEERDLFTINPNGEVIQRGAGFFEQLFTFVPSFLLQTTIATVTYFAIGMPYSAITGELFKSNIQAVLDIAVNKPLAAAGAGQSLSTPGAIEKAFQRIEIFGTLGEEVSSKTPKEIDDLLHNLKGQSTYGLEKDAIDYFDDIGSIIGYQNIAYRTRAKIMFTRLMKPFLLDTVNPFTPSSSATVDDPYYKFKNRVYLLEHEVGKPIYVRQETHHGVNRYEIANMGLERQKQIAKAWDDVAELIPLNFTLWNWKRGVYTNPTDFLSVADVFSFTDLVNTFERVGHNFHMSGHIANAYRNSYSSNPMQSIKDKALMGTGIAMNVLAGGIARLKGSFSMYGLIIDGSSIVRQSRKIRKFEEQLINLDILKWDADKGVAFFDWDNANLDGGVSEIVDSYFEAVEEYHDVLYADNRNQAKLRMIRNRAAKYQGELKRGYYSLFNSKRLIKNDFIRNASKQFIPFAIAALGFSLMADDLAQSTSGTSLFSQFRYAFSKETGADRVEFTPGGLLPFQNAYQKAMLSLAWSGISIGLGLLIGAVTQGMAFQFYEGTGIDKLTELMNSQKIFKRGVSPDSITKISKILKTGMPVLKGNYFLHAAIATTAVFASGSLLKHAITGTGNFIMGLLRNDSITPATDLIMASQLVSFRNTVLNKVRKRETVTDHVALGAYVAGSIIERSPGQEFESVPPSTRVIAKQAPWAIIQFFLAETVKNKKYDSQGKVIDKGISTFTFGIQSSPTIGINATFSFPIAIDWQVNNKLGMSLAYNPDSTNVIAYLQTLGQINASVLLTVGFGVYLASAISSAFSYSGRRLGTTTEVGKYLDRMGTEFKLVSNTFRSFINTTDTLLSFIAGAPNTAISTANAIFTADMDFYKRIFNKPFMSTRSHIMVSLAQGSVLLPVFFISRFAADVASDNKRFINAVSFGATALAAGAIVFPYFSNRLKHSWNATAGKVFVAQPPISINVTTPTIPSSNISSRLNRVSRRISNVFNHKHAGRVGLVAASFLYAWQLASSDFGYSHGMDLDEDNNVTPMSIWSKTVTAGLYASYFALLSIKVADFGLSPVSAVDKYVRITNKISQANKLNPMYWHLAYKRAMLKKDLKHELGLIEDVASEARLVSNTLNSVLNPAAKQQALSDLQNDIAKVKAKHISDVNDLMNQDTADSVKKVFSNIHYKEFTKFRRSSKLFRIATTVAIGNMVFTIAASAIGGLVSGQWGGQENQTAFFDATVDNPRLPQGTDSKAVRYTVIEPIGNVIRLITGWDKVLPTSNDIASYLAQDSTGEVIGLKRGSRLLEKSDPQAVRLANAVSILAAPFIINPMNAYQSVFAGIGVTFRRGEYGIRSNYYLQIQTAGQDISTAVYSMAPAFLYRNATGFSSLYKTLVSNGIELIMKGQEIPTASDEQLSKISSLILTASGNLNPLPPSKRRSFTALTKGFGGDLIASDPILSLALRERSRRLTELSYQPIESIYSRMYDMYSPSILVGRTKGLSLINAFGLVGADKTLLEGREFQAALLHRLNPLNKVSMRSFSIYFNRETKRLERTETGIDEVSEILDETVTHLSSEDKSTNFLLRIGADFAVLASQKIPLLDTLGIGLGLTAVGGLIFGLSALGASLAWGAYSNALFTNADRYKHVLGGLSSKETAKEGFFLYRKTKSTDLSRSVNQYVIVKGDRVFKVWSPIENGIIDGTSLYDALGQVQVEVISNTGRMVEDTSASDRGIASLFDRLYDELSGVSGSSPVQRHQVWKNYNKSGFISKMDELVRASVESKVKASFRAFFEKKVRVTTSTGVEEVPLGTLINSEMKEAWEKGQIDAYIDKEAQQVIDSISQKVRTALSDQVQYQKGDGHLPDQPLSKIRPDTPEGIEQTIVAVVKNQLNDYVENINTNLGGILTAEDPTYLSHLEQAVVEAGGNIMSPGSPQTSRLTQSTTPIPKIKSTATTSTVSTFSVAPPPGRMTRPQGFMQATKWAALNVIDWGTKFMGFAEVADIFNAYMQLAQAFENGSYDKRMAADYASMTTFNSLLGIAISIAAIESIKYIGGVSFATVAGGIALTTVGWALLIGAAAVGVTGWLLRDPISNLINRIGATKFMTGASQWIGNSVEGLYSWGGNLLYSMASIPKVGPLLTRVFGTTLATLALGAIVYNLGSVAATTAGAAYTITYATLAKGAALVGAVYGTVASMPGVRRIFNVVENSVSGAVNFLGNTAFGSWFVGTINSVPFWKKNFYFEPGSPFYSGTAGQAIRNEFEQQLMESGDWTGKDSMSLFITPMIYGTTFYSQVSDPSRDQFNIRPHSMSSPLIDRELAIRAQYYNHSVIGNYYWHKLISASKNYKALKRYMNHTRDNPQAATNPQDVSVLREAEGSIKKDVKVLNARIKKQGEGEYGIPYKAAVLALSKARGKGLEVRSNERVNTTVAIQKKDVNSAYVEQQQSIAYSTYRKTPVVSTEVSVNKVSDSQYYVARQVSNSNDVLKQAYIGLKVSPT